MTITLMENNFEIGHLGTEDTDENDSTGMYNILKDFIISRYLLLLFV